MGGPAGVAVRRLRRGGAGRRYALLLAVLLALDAVVRVAVPAPDFEDDFVLPYNSLRHLRAYLDHIRGKAAEGARVVVFLGDSSFNSRIPRGTPNLPECFAAALARRPGGGKFRVYNVSAAGLDLASRYFIVRELSSVASAVYLNVNFRVFTAGERAVVAYPQLWSELMPRVSETDRARLALDRGEGRGWVVAAEARLDAGLNGVWALKGRSMEMKDFFFGHFHPRQWAVRLGASLLGAPGWDGAAAPPRDEWSFPLSGFSPASRDRVLRANRRDCPNERIGPESADVHFLGRIVAEANRSGLRVVVFTSPFSVHLNELHGFYDRGIYRANVGRVRSVVQGRSVRFLDYNAEGRAFDPRPGGDFFQAYEHLTFEANTMFAARLLADTETFLGARSR